MYVYTFWVRLIIYIYICLCQPNPKGIHVHFRENMQQLSGVLSWTSLKGYLEK